MIRALLLSCALALPAAAQAPGDSARQAATALEAAQIALDQAEGARDRVAALTATVRAFEDGLAALREGLREASIRETRLRRDLAAREGEVAALLGALQSISSQGTAEQMLHPAGPVGAARAGMLVASVTPGLAGEALALRDQLEEVEALRALQEDAADTLRRGLSGVQTARTALSQAIAERTELPRRFTEDPIKTAILIAATETLSGFASGLSEIGQGEIPDAPEDISARTGALPLPVAGQVLRRSGEADAAGVARPGLVLATRPGALVTTPVPATIRYRGPLLDYGLVTILEPQADLLFVLAGLDTAFGEIGEVLDSGAPVGLMGGAADTDALQTTSGSGNPRPETLYIEVRQNNAPVDPLTWFATDKG
ncbi:murein hydrolase activator EnvC family protein [Litorisediminicola beolgyonensis]|uniref:Murein hydrolase activator EnvC family protein n=1 Tax=Litorisediminicola beolgyonensis TaxID=1173614 RepID=A0ABW3ZK61_9RHOB